MAAVNRYEMTASGRVHRLVLQDGDVLSREACNLDDAGERTAITEDEFLRIAVAERERLCRRCFPPISAMED